MLEKFRACRENQMGPTFAVMVSRVLNDLEDAREFYPLKERAERREELKLIK